MSRTPYLVKRGHMFWWRRRKPVFTLPQPSRGTDRIGAAFKERRPQASGHFAVSLRTTCPKEAGRRAARLNLLFEEKRRSIEIALYGNDAMNDHTFLLRAQADMAASMRAQAEMLVQLMAQAQAQALPAVAALPHEQPAPPFAAVPQTATAAAPGAPGASRIDDPEFERAVLEMAEREGWWHDNPDDIVAQFDMMLTGLFTLQEEYLRYCVRRGLDPVATLPSLASLGDALSSVASDIGADRGPATAVARGPDAPHPVSVRKTRARKGAEGRRFSEHARRFLDLRSEGFDLKKRNETPDRKAGERFSKTSRANFEGTIRVFLEAHGDMSVEQIDEVLLADFFSLLDRIPAAHGKSSKDRRPVRQVIEETDRKERNEIERRKAEMDRDGLSPGEIEETLDALRIRRLRTNTCKRNAARV